LKYSFNRRERGSLRLRLSMHIISIISLTNPLFSLQSILVWQIFIFNPSSMRQSFMSVALMFDGIDHCCLSDHYSFIIWILFRLNSYNYITYYYSKSFQALINFYLIFVFNSKDINLLKSVLWGKDGLKWMSFMYIEEKVISMILWQQYYPTNHLRAKWSCCGQSCLSFRSQLSLLW